MVKEIEASGICCTCNNRWLCLSLRNSLKRRESIQYCEEFDDSEIKHHSGQIDAKERRMRAHSFNQPFNFGIKI